MQPVQATQLFASLQNWPSRHSPHDSPHRPRPHIWPDGQPHMLGSECAYSFGGSYHRASSRKAMLMDMKRLSSTEVQYVGRHSGKWADFITLEVGEDADGWKVLRVIKHEAA